MRIGHARFVKQYLVKNEASPECIACAQIITVKHLLLECDDYVPQRIRFFGRGELNIKDLLGTSEVNSIRNVLSFFKEIGLYNQI